ncbi:hypothetical protein LTR94_026680 [Friedmanniomyces endolithicus]|nr:hypothetical protein LTR94_026680 [Friedmanniomyces endolithicus]
MVLHGYWRSGASYRVRIGLNLKGVDYSQVGRDLRKNEQKSPDFLALNPQGLTPTLVDGDLVLSQSPAILEWLEESRPEPPLLPAGSAERAQVRAMAALIGCDIHPLNNLRVLRTIRAEFDADQASVDAWAQRWIIQGFDALEVLVGRYGQGWSFGDAPALSTATSFNLGMEAWPRLMAIGEQAALHPAFQAAHPDVQPDADG